MTYFQAAIKKKPTYFRLSQMSHSKQLNISIKKFLSIYSTTLVSFQFWKFKCNSNGKVSRFILASLHVILTYSFIDLNKNGWFLLSMKIKKKKLNKNIVKHSKHWSKQQTFCEIFKRKCFFLCVAIFIALWVGFF